MPDGAGGCRIVALIGLMGAGKTTVGRALATLLDRDFVDLDERIERAAGRRITEIFATEGEAGFRTLERAATRSLASEGASVVATGGGWAVDPENVHRLGEHAVTVWLRVDPRTAAERLRGETAGRPKLNGSDPAASLERLLHLREAHYRAADLHIETGGRTADEVAVEIARILRAARWQPGHEIQRGTEWR
jgi:shikimate kinase